MENITEKKKAIFDSTLKLIVEKGFHGCPMSQVAKDADVAAGTIYHHFENKDQLIQELYHYTMERIVGAMFEGDDKSLPFKERFFIFCRNLFSFYTQNPDVLAFYPKFLYSPYNTSRYEEGHDRFHVMLFSFFKEGVDNGSLRQMNPEIIGVLTNSNVMTGARIRNYGKIKLEEPETEQIFQVLWDGIEKKPEW